jgi:hypothetical protein
MRKQLGALVLLAGLAACSSGEHLESAERAVAEFRELMSGRQFAQVYAGASEELRNASTEANLVRILDALHSKLGRTSLAEKSGWNVNFHSSGTFVSLGFKTQFEKGAGVEQFVFRISDGKARLVSYNVNSPALLLN